MRTKFKWAAARRRARRECQRRFHRGVSYIDKCGFSWNEGEGPVNFHMSYFNGYVYIYIFFFGHRFFRCLTYAQGPDDGMDGTLQY